MELVGHVVCLVFITLIAHARASLEVSNIECNINTWEEGDGATGFQGRVTITVHADTSGGWEMYLTFGSGVENVAPYSHAAVKEVVDGSTYLLENVDYTEDMLVSESPYVFEYGAKVYGSIPSCAACFVGYDCTDTTPGPTTPTTTGDGSTNPTTTGSTPPPGDWPYDYNEVLRLSILFYEAQRSGDLPDDNRVPWRGDSAMSDGSDVGVDLLGGWYDAGDHVKFGFPMASSVTNLAWGVHVFWEAYETAGQLDRVVDSIKWPLDYFLKIVGSDTLVYAQVADGYMDHAFWGSPEDMTMERPVYTLDASRPGTELACETATALAVSSLVFRRYGNEEYADTLLANARILYDFGINYQAKYSDSIPEVQDFYNSWNGYEDELAFSSMWMYKVTGELVYLENGQAYFPGYAGSLYSWDDKTAGAMVLYHELDPTNRETAQGILETFVNNWAFGGADIVITPGGLSWGNTWGPLRYTANAAFIALLGANQGILPDVAVDFAEQNLHYMLGDYGHSFVCGFGVNPPQKPHHRGSSCVQGNSCDINAGGPNPNVLSGALVGGPDQNDNWIDDRTDYIANEVATDYNAGFQSAIAGLITYRS